MNQVTYSVYSLVCPVDKKPKYVGRTNNLPRRYGQHMVGRGGSIALRKWIEELKSKGVRPIMNELETDLLFDRAVEQELDWIVKLHSEFGTLLNHRGVKQRQEVDYPINYLNK